MTQKFVSYVRVSTAKQGHSGLGLDAQRQAVARFIGGAELIREFREIESGKNNDRPELAKALKTCRLTGATLVVARLDRLSRNVAFLAALMDAGVDFVAVDNPNASPLTVHVLAALAQHERHLISERTKAALAAAKARGVRLGRRDHDIAAHATAGAVASAEIRSKAARAHADGLREAIEDVRAEIGADASLRAIADALNSRSYRSPRGKPITFATVQRALAA